MLNSFAHNKELLDGYETDYLKILYYDLSKNYSGRYESKSYTRFCTILEGEKHVSIGNEDIVYTKDQFLLLSPYSHVEMEIPKPTKALVFELSDELIRKVSKKVIKDKTYDTKVDSYKNIIVGKNNKDISEDISLLFKHTIKKSKRESFIVDLYAQKLLYDLLKVQHIDSVLKTSNNHPILKTTEYIHNHIKESIQVNQLANMVNMEVSNYSHSFKKLFGLSPQKYINNAKLELASELLINNSVTDVAFDLGYEHLSHFIRLFKNKYDLTPKQYQLRDNIK